MRRLDPKTINNDTHEIFPEATIILYYGNGNTSNHPVHEHNPEHKAKRLKRLFGAQSYFIKNKEN